MFIIDGVRNKGEYGIGATLTYAAGILQLRIELIISFSLIAIYQSNDNRLEESCSGTSDITIMSISAETAMKLRKDAKKDIIITDEETLDPENTPTESSPANALRRAVDIVKEKPKQSE